MVKIITNNDMSEAKSSKLAVIDFSATWCGPCQMLAPVMEELSEELAGKVDIYSVDVDKNSELTEEFSIMSVPAIIVLKDGEKVDMAVGFQPKAAMQAFIEKYIDKIKGLNKSYENVMMIGMNYSSIKEDGNE